MRRNLVVAAIGVIAFFVGFGIGNSGKTKTVEKTVTSTRTHTVTVAKTRLAAHRTTVVPKGCIEAIADARRFARLAGDGFAVAEKWPTLASQAAVAAAAQDSAKIYSIAATLRTGTAKLNALTAEVATDGLAFDAAAARCR